jgi:DMSO/TMAO reductase YedYZ molybdopterin-dependent catalytic subunit
LIFSITFAWMAGDAGTTAPPSDCGGSMAPHHGPTEDEYLERVAHQVVAAGRSSGRIDRRGALRFGALGVSAFVAAAKVGPFGGARADAAPVRSRPDVPSPPAVPPSGPFFKPLPPEWFNVFGTNAEMRWDAVAGLGYTIPNERFYVRSHTGSVGIDARTWRLRVFGSGVRDEPDLDHAFTLSYDQLRRLPSETTTAFLECAGNGRRFFADQQGTPAPGTAWSLGAVGVARWRGVPLREVLHRAGIKRGAVDVLPQGLDADFVSNGTNLGKVRRVLPVAKALDDALLVYEMNGEPLPPDHGFPVRLLVPGWIGVASIKWLGQIEVSDQPLLSPFDTTLYRLIGPTYPPDQPPISTTVVKSAFELAAGAEFPAGERTVLRGRSWSGNAPIREVEVSTDDGATWRRADVRDRWARHGWQRWELPWRPTAAGPQTLRARATDRSGATQPDTVPFNTGGYLFDGVVRHPVVVA